MALIIEGGISIGGNINIIAENINPTANLILFYDAGNSMCYSGSGSDFSIPLTGPNITGYQQYGVIDLAGVIGNVWHSGELTYGGDPITWTSQGVSSYWTLNAANDNYISGDWQQGPTLNSPTYTMLAVVRPQDFSLGAIVGGDEQVFTFVSNGGLDDGPSLAASNSYFGPPAVIDTTTAYELDTWYCVAVTYDAGTGVMKLYTNGNLVATSTGINSPTHPTGLYWGTLEGQLWYTGDMSVCMAYERVLSASEIAQLSTVYLSRYIDISAPATSSVVFDIPYLGGPPATFVVPEGVNSISVVAVGGGGGGTQDEYGVPGGDTVMIRTDNFVYVATTYTGTSNNILVDSTLSPNIANVQDNGSWIAGGFDIGSIGMGIPAWDLVTGVDSTDPANVVITIDQTITTTAGDQFFFYEAVAAAEGGYEITGAYYNSASTDPYSGTPNGPGARALPLVTDSPYGQGGVVDWTVTYPVGGGAAGGYGLPGLALNINQSGTWFYNTEPDVGYHTMALSNNNLTVTALVGMGASNANQECMALGTKTIPTAGAKVMYSVIVSQTAGIGYCGIGLANYYENLCQYPGYSFNSIGYYDDGRVFVDTEVVGTFAAFNEGGIVDIAVDTDLGLVWFRVAGGTWNSGGNPATGTEGFDINAILSSNNPITLALAPWYDDTSAIADIISIATSAAYSVPAGFTFIPGVSNAGGTGGDGASFWAGTNNNGTGGSGAGGGGRYEDSGAGGSGTGLYGLGTNGLAGSFITNGAPANAVSTVSTGGSNNAVTDGAGGQATPWNGGRGGWPGGGGGSATGYWIPGNGGALAYRNNYSVTPGEEYIVLPGIGGSGQNNGGSGANGAVRIVWPGNTRQFPATNVGPDTVSVPTLDITSGNFSGSSPTGQVYFNITDDGGSEVLETGIVWGLPGQDTYLASTDVCDGSSDVAQRKAIRADDSCSNPFTTGLTGSQSLIFMADSSLYNETLDVRAYARNAAGVAYSPTVLTWTPTICLAEGTLITLADGSTKTIEAISMSDLIKVWDFDNGAVASATPLWIKRRESTIQYNAIEFSDGTILKTIGQHRIFNKQAKSFTYPMTDDTPVGTITVKSDGTEITLVSKKVVYEKVNYYNVITSGGYLNCYAEGILTSCRYSNMYPITNMQYNKDGRALRDRNEFVGISDRWIDGLRLPEQTIDIKHIRKYVERLENNEKQEPITRATTAWQQ
jgi:hypothetical protein